MIAWRSRGTPRIVNRLLRRARDYAQVRAAGHIDVEVAAAALDVLGIDAIGLDELDRRVLGVLCGTLGGHPVGVQTIAVSVQEDPDTIEDVVEPFLIRSGLLARTLRGRLATAAAYQHLGSARPRLAAPGAAGGAADRALRALRSADFDYPLPTERIAQEPLAERDASRLLLIIREDGDLEDRWFIELPELLRPGDLLVANETRVRNARLRGLDSHGRDVELLVLERRSEGSYLCLAGPARLAAPGAVIRIGEHLQATVIGPSGAHPGGRCDAPMPRTPTRPSRLQGTAPLLAVYPRDACGSQADTRRSTRAAAPDSSGGADGRAALHRACHEAPARAGHRLGDVAPRCRPRHLRSHPVRRASRTTRCIEEQYALSAATVEAIGRDAPRGRDASSRSARPWSVCWRRARPITVCHMQVRDARACSSARGFPFASSMGWSRTFISRAHHCSYCLRPPSLERSAGCAAYAHALGKATTGSSPRRLHALLARCVTQAFTTLAVDGAARTVANCALRTAAPAHTCVHAGGNTHATVKALHPRRGARGGRRHPPRCNAYHLALRPGIVLIERAGGLHAFMGWDHPILTDSGGYQLVSLAEVAAVDDDGATFVSPYDGSRLRVTPEDAVTNQARLGADILMRLDHPVAHGTAHETARDATARTHRWAERCREAHPGNGHLLFGIAQGGFDEVRRGASRRGSRRGSTSTASPSGASRWVSRWRRC